MRYYVDIDGTLTTRQRRWQPLRDDCVAYARALLAAGHEVIIWSGDTGYARRWCAKHGIEPTAALGKPERIIDNQPNRWLRLFGRRMQTPEQWLQEGEKSNGA